MATTKRELSHKIDSSGKSEIIIRLSAGRGLQPRLKTGLFITPSRLKNGSIIKPRANQTEATELRRIETELNALEQFLLNLCTSIPTEQLSREYLNDQINRYRHPEQYADEKSAPIDFFGAFNEYLEKHPLSPTLVNNYRVLLRAMRRYELYTSAIGKPFSFTLDGLTHIDIEHFEYFLRTEHDIYPKFRDIYNTMPADTRKGRKCPAPTPRGDNTICCIFKRFRAFFNWCNEQGLTDNKPFSKYCGVSSEKYGTPYYITIDERDRIADFDLSHNQRLEAQRDIFIFQCLIGCRVSDLIRLTPSNVINGAIEYIANKTRQDRPEVIRVPLHARAAALVEKYAGRADGRLFPFISQQRYNDDIKKIFTAAGITRAVTILNPATGQEEQRPINEIASSHLARRTFIGNLYKRVKDPNLVGSLSGHKEGSRAFARYRDIDEDMKKDLINLL